MMLLDGQGSLPTEMPAARGRQHVYERPPEPVVFPESEEMPETNLHLELRTALYLLLKRELASRATVGSDQFVYWNPQSAKQRLAPDAFVRLGAPHRLFRTWKVWERGAPDLAVEIVSVSDRRELSWNEKLERYRAAGIREVVRFNPRDRKRPVRIWDAIGGDLVERAPSDPALLACETLRLWWTVVKDAELGPMLRLSRDREGRDLLLTPTEAEAEAKAKARAAEAKAREAEAKAREAEAKANEANEGLRAEVERLRGELAKVRGKARKR